MMTPHTGHCLYCCDCPMCTTVRNETSRLALERVRAYHGQSWWRRLLRLTPRPVPPVVGDEITEDNYGEAMEVVRAHLGIQEHSEDAR